MTKQPPHQRFSGAYQRGDAPWDIGRPQPEFVSLVDSGRLPVGRVLDVGCGRGDNALFFAERGADVVGVDAVASAIDSARTKAAERDLTERACFVVGDVLECMAGGDARFDLVIDSGFFHSLSDGERPAFVDCLARTLGTGGLYAMLCFSDRVPRGFGPRRISEAEIRGMFGLPWFEVLEVRPAELHTAIWTMPVIDANLGLMRRV